MKIIRTIAIAASAILLLLSCAKEKTILMSPIGDSVGIFADVEASVIWNDPDSVFIWQSEKNNGVLHTSDGSGRWNFTGTLDSSFNPDKECRFLSNVAAISGFEAGKIYTAVPEEQTGDADDWPLFSISYSALAIPVSNGDGSFHLSPRTAMKNLTSAVDVTLPEGLEIKSLVAEGFSRADKTRRNITGTMTFCPADASITGLRADNGSGKVSLELTTSADERSIRFWLAPGDGAVDSLCLTFTNPDGIEKALGFTMENPLSPGQSINLGKVKVVYPIPLKTTVFSIKHAADIELSLSNNQAEHLYYTFKVGSEPEDPTETSAEWISTTHIYPQNDCYYKVLAVSEGCTSSLSKAYVRMDIAVKGFSITIPSGGSKPVGFATVTNSHPEDQPFLTVEANGCYQIYQGGYLDFHFNAKHNCDGALYLKLRNEKKVTFFYDGTDKGNYKNTGDTKKWYTHNIFKVSVKAGKEVMFRPNTNDTLIYGFAWLEQGF